MNVNDIFFQVTSNLTGGLITDFGTAVVGLVLLLVIMAGLDLLKQLFETSIVNRRAEKNFSVAETYRNMRDVSDSESLEYDYYNALYKKHLSESVSLSAKTGKNFASTEDDLFS